LLRKREEAITKLDWEKANRLDAARATPRKRKRAPRVRILSYAEIHERLVRSPGYEARHQEFMAHRLKLKDEAIREAYGNWKPLKQERS
jgi:hypothetical protein